MAWLVWKDGTVESKDIDIQTGELLIPATPKRTAATFSETAHLPPVDKGSYSTRRFARASVSPALSVDPVYVEEGTSRERYRQALLEIQQRLRVPSPAPEEGNGDEPFTVPGID